MRLVSVRLDAFGALRGAQYEFAPGLNLVLGPNESGKSTIVEAVFGVLFGFKSNRERFLPRPGGGEYQAGLAIQSAGRLLEITRDFSSNQLRVIERINNEEHLLLNEKISPSGRSSDREQYLDLLQQTLGLSDPQLFRALVLIGQEKLLGSWQDGASGIRTLLAGAASRGSDEVLDALEQQYFELTLFDVEGRKRMRNPRKIELLQSQIESRREALDHAQRALDKRQQLGVQRSQMREQLVAKRTELDSHELLAKRGAELLRLQKDLAETERLHAELYKERLQLVDALNDLAATNAALAGLSDVTALSAVDFESAGKLAADAQAIGREQRGLDRIGEQLEAINPQPALSAAMVSVATAIGAGLGLALLPSPWSWVAAIALLCVPGTLWVRLVVLRRSARNATQQLTQSLSQAREACAELEAQYEHDLEALPSAIRLSLDDLSIVRARYEQARDLTLKREQAAALVAGRPDDEQLQQALAKLGRELDVHKARIDSFVAQTPQLSGVDQRAVLQADRDAAACRQRIEEFEQQLRSVESDFTVASVGLIDRQSAEEEIVELDQRLARDKRRAQALLLAREVLAEAIEEFRSLSVARVGEAIGSRFERCTAGRYCGVEMDEQFNPLPLLRGKVQLDVEQLSAGARDQLYLCARLAVLDDLSGDAGLPLILDDPLVHCDRKRRTALLELLRELADRQQLIVLSHDESLAELTPGANLIRLGTDRQ
ncbi:MAG: AAA family ATPase [Candidatus Alcyoniella australis]|nr:AAA family ATPase [Candidatus Alcyoniella australis]